jgi:glycosyltransferase involved in cell wall biosynthesis
MIQNKEQKEVMIHKKLKITMLGFDWNDICFNDPDFMISKLDRDGINSQQNEFVNLYAGNKIKRSEIRKNPRFYIWHFWLFSKNRVLYDFFFIIFLPFILLYEKFKPDIFCLYDLPFILSAILPAKLCGSKIFFRFHNLPTQLSSVKGKKGRLYSIYYRIIEKITFPFIDRFIAINETTKQYLLNRNVDPKKILIDTLDTIVSDERYIKNVSSDYLRQKYNIPSDKKIILSIGSLLPEKGFSELIDTLSRFKRNDLILIICGDGKEKNNLIELSAGLGVKDRVFFAGRVGREEIWNYYFGADIFMLFTKFESLGMVFWEAMYAELPVIGTPVGGVIETIGEDGERGFYCKNNLEDLKNKIDFCLDKTKKDREFMIERARNYVQEKIKSKMNINDLFFNFYVKSRLGRNTLYSQ